MSSNIFVLLYYKFTPIKNAKFEAKQHKLVCKGIGLNGRIIISEEGINGTVAGNRAQLKEYTDYMDNHPDFRGIVFKRSVAPKMPFHKMIVKYRPEIVTLGKKVDLKKTGKYLKPEQMHELFEKGEDMVVVDMRNNYEWEVGRFDGAIQPDTVRFFELPEKVKNLKIDKNKKEIGRAHV